MEELKQWLVDEKANPRVIDGMKELIGLNDEVKETSYNVESSAIELSCVIMKLDKVLNPDMFNDEDMLDLDEVDYSDSIYLCLSGLWTAVVNCDWADCSYSLDVS